MLTHDSAARVATSEVEHGHLEPSRRTEVLVPEFSEIYRMHFGFVWSCTRRLGVTDGELDDIVQEVFIVIHERLQTLEQPASLRSWIYSVVRRIVSTYHRARRSKEVSTTLIRTVPDLQYPRPPSPQELAEQSDQVKLLWSLLEKLDPLRREVFVLAELDEMTVPEIAAAIDVPVNTVYSRLRAARQELEEALARHTARTRERGRLCPT